MYSIYTSFHLVKGSLKAQSWTNRSCHPRRQSFDRLLGIQSRCIDWNCPHPGPNAKLSSSSCKPRRKKSIQKLKAINVKFKNCCLLCLTDETWRPCEVNFNHLRCQAETTASSRSMNVCDLHLSQIAFDGLDGPMFQVLQNLAGTRARDASLHLPLLPHWVWQ